MPGRDIDLGWAWVVLLASYMNLLLCSGLSFVSGMFQVVFLEQFQGSVALTSWVTSLFSSLMQLGGPFSSVVTSYANCRASVILGGALLSIGLVLSAMADSLGLLFAAFGVVAGCGLGLTYSASIIVINYYFEKRRTMVTGIALSSSGLGIAIAPQISNILFHMFSWREALIVLAGASAHICIFGALMFPMHEKWKAKCLCRKKSSFRCGDGTNHEYTCNDCTACLQDYESYTEGKPSLTENNLRDKEQYVCNRSNSHKEKVPNLNGNHEFVDLSCSEMSIKNNHVPSTTSKEGILPLKTGSHCSGLSVNVRSASIESFPFNKLLHHRHRHLSQTQSHYELSQNQHKQLIKSNNNSSKVQSQSELQRRPRADTEKLDLGHLEFQKVLPVKTDILGSSQQIFQLKEPTLPNQLQNEAVLRLPKQHAVVCHNQSLLSLVPSIRQLQVVSVTSDNSLDPEGKYIECETEKTLISVTQNSPFSLFRNVSFWILCAQLFIANCGCGIFNIHLPSFSKSKGLTDQEMTNILSINGMALLFGRMLVGFVANATQLDLLMYWALHLAGGLFVILMPDVGTSYLSMCLLTLCTGFYYGSVYAVLTSITITYVGLDDLATAFGVEMVCAGLGYLVAPPLAGLLVDITGSYNYNMYCGGAVLMLSSFVTLLLPVVNPVQNTAHPDFDIYIEENDDTNNDDDVDQLHSSDEEREGLKSF